MINSRLLALLAATSLLAAWFAWQDGTGLFGLLGGSIEVVAPQPAPSQPDTPASAGLPVVNPLHGLAAAQLPDISARPLFNPTRAPRPAPQPVVDTQPPPDNPPPQTAEVNPADYELLAVAGSDGGRVAVVRFAPDNRIYHLRRGQFLAEWQVSEVGDRTLTLRRADKSFEIAMFKPPSETQAPAGGSVTPPDAGGADSNGSVGADGTDQ